MAQAFVKHSPAPDGIHDTVAFNEYRDPKWWSQQRHRRWLIEAIAPYLLGALLLGGFLVVGVIDRW